MATDLSPAMLAQAPAHPRIRYAEAPAEQLPVKDDSVDLLSVTLAFTGSTAPGSWPRRDAFCTRTERSSSPVTGSNPGS